MLFVFLSIITCAATAVLLNLFRKYVLYYLFCCCLCCRRKLKKKLQPSHDRSYRKEKFSVYGKQKSNKINESEDDEDDNDDDEEDSAKLL